MAAPDSPGREFAEQMKSFDSNNDGSLTAEELQAGLISMGVSKSASEAYMSAGDKIEIKEGTNEMNALQGKLSKLAEMKSALAEAEKARDKAEEERQAAEGALLSKRADEIAQEEAKRLEEKRISQLQLEQEEGKDRKNRAAEERAEVLLGA